MLPLVGQGDSPLVSSRIRGGPTVGCLQLETCTSPSPSLASPALGNDAAVRR